MVTIHDLAKTLKVSAATVSRALNDGPVSAKTRARIQQAAVDAGYIPDERAKSLKSANASKIGVIIPDISNPAYPGTVRVLHDLMKSKGYSLLIGNTYGEEREERQLLDMMRRERVAGVIVAASENGNGPYVHHAFDSLCAQGIHSVFLGSACQQLQYDSVRTNNTSGAERLTDYLIRTGRDKIAFISGRESIQTSERLKGYQASLNHHGISYEQSRVICSGPFTVENGARLARPLLAKHRVDAIFCANDLMAIGVLQAAVSLGIRVPHDIAVAGFDDIPMAEWVTPRLTTVRQNFEELAGTACELLLERINGQADKDAIDLVIDPELIVRESA